MLPKSNLEVISRNKFVGPVIRYLCTLEQTDYLFIHVIAIFKRYWHVEYYVLMLLLKNKYYFKNEWYLKQNDSFKKNIDSDQMYI
jgi:hypothetical protein